MADDDLQKWQQVKMFDTADFGRVKDEHELIQINKKRKRNLRAFGKRNDKN